MHVACLSQTPSFPSTFHTCAKFQSMDSTCFVLQDALSLTLSLSLPLFVDTCPGILVSVFFALRSFAFHFSRILKAFLHCRWSDEAYTQSDRFGTFRILCKHFKCLAKFWDTFLKHTKKKRSTIKITNSRRLRALGFCFSLFLFISFITFQYKHL